MRVGRSCLLRLVLVLAAALAVAAVDLPGRPQTLCLLRAATGLPCPLCGGTTAVVAIGQGRPLAALAASPLVTLGAAVLLLAPAAPAGLRGLFVRHRFRLVLTALVAGEAWQLTRLT